MNQHVLLQKRKADTQKKKTQEWNEWKFEHFKVVVSRGFFEFFYFIKPTHLGPK